MIETALILSVCVALITLISRHRLSVRHKALKVTLNRVAGERDAARWRLKDVERLSAEIPHDVRRLVIAARMVAFSESRPHGSPQSQDEVEWIELLSDLDEASEAFAERIPWDNEPDQ